MSSYIEFHKIILIQLFEATNIILLLNSWTWKLFLNFQATKKWFSSSESKIGWSSDLSCLIGKTLWKCRIKILTFDDNSKAHECVLGVRSTFCKQFFRKRYFKFLSRIARWQSPLIKHFHPNLVTITIMLSLLARHSFRDLKPVAAFMQKRSYIFRIRTSEKAYKQKDKIDETWVNCYPLIFKY